MRFVWWYLVRLLFFQCIPAGRHSDSIPDSRRVRLCSRLPCGSYGAGSPTAVVACSRELVSCGNGGTVVEWIPARPCEFSLHFLDHFTCAPSCSYCAFFRRESILIIVFPGRILISLGFSDLPRARAPLCDHGLWMFDNRDISNNNKGARYVMTSDFIFTFYGACTTCIISHENIVYWYEYIPSTTVRFVPARGSNYSSRAQIELPRPPSPTPPRRSPLFFAPGPQFLFLLF